MEQKSYGDVVTGAATVTADLKRAIADSRVARAKNRAAMEDEWAELLESMPKMIEAIDKKIAVQGSKPPKGMEKDAWKQLVESYDAARDAWGATAAGMKKRNIRGVGEGRPRREGDDRGHHGDSSGLKDS